MKTQKLSLISLIAALIMAPAMTFAAGVPENITGVTSTAVDGASIALSWNGAKDAGNQALAAYRIYYGTTSVQTLGTGDYDKTVDTPDNKTTYVATGLKPNTTYYFAVTGLSTDGLESDEYSWESSAKTLASSASTDTVAPTVTTVSALDKSHVKVVFSEAVNLPAIAPELAFSINQQVNPSATLEVKSVKIDNQDITGKTVVLETATQTKNINYIVTAGISITDKASNPIVSGSTDSGVFAGSDAEPVVQMTLPTTTPDEVVALEDITPVTEEKDVTPPEDVTNILLSFKEQVSKLFTILADWTPSVNSAKDLADQVMYMSLDKGKTYDSGKPLGDKAAHAEVADLEGGKEYTFKITTKDKVGNESAGAIKAIRLPQSGIGISFIVASSLAAASHILKRRRK